MPDTDDQSPEQPHRDTNAPRSLYPTLPEDWQPSVVFAHEERMMASRRRFLKYAIGAGTGAFGLALALPALAIRTLTQRTETPQAGDVLVYAQGGSAGQPVVASNVPVGSGVLVFPEGKSDNNNNLIELVRLSDGDDGFVAFSAICTHLGCTVYGELNENGNIACPCHQSNFDPSDDAAVTSGPAARALPGLPVVVGDDNFVAVNGEFDGAIGVA